MIPWIVLTGCCSLFKTFKAEKTTRTINEVSNAVNGFLWLNEARKKNKPENNAASVTMKYLKAIFEKAKNIPNDKKEAIINKTTLARLTALFALYKKRFLCSCFSLNN